MDIGDIGFLIVALIVFVINFLVKAKKDKTQSEKPVAPELTEPWEVKEKLPPIFENTFDWERKPEVIRKKTPRPVPVIPESYESKKIRLQSQEGMSSLSESLFKDDEMESVSYDEDSDSDSEFYIEDIFHGSNITDELKKGIIYSEILHRKYE
ncbi:MAG: hypothetical protein PHO84_06235 [Dysgonamonadaceae bacterium]|jgi:hypothetical protein|nr:hypothetical protein [Dysgonamonadaceae bacterium]MDD4246737.1 hypothetical protein [Dysgonamonadaceae bacterium]MDD4605778.1 hypothetical protein [Dysgonamonadaceae bacterium]